MKPVVDHVSRLTRRYAQLPFFDFLRDERLSPLQRLAFMPALAPLVLAHGDLHRHVLRASPPMDPIQRMVNTLTIEDEPAWNGWFDDLERLDPEQPMRPSEWLRQQSGGSGEAGRVLGHRLAFLGWSATPLVRLALLGALRQTRGVLFDAAAPLAAAHRERTGMALTSLGEPRVASNGSQGSHAAWAGMHALTLTATTRAGALACVDEVFSHHTRWTYELLRHVHARLNLPSRGLALHPTPATAAGIH